MVYLYVVRGMLVGLGSEAVRVGHEWVQKSVLLGGNTAAAGEEYMRDHIFVAPLVEPWEGPWAEHQRCQGKCHLPIGEWENEQNAGGLEVVGGKYPGALDYASLGRVGIEDKTRSGEVGAVATLGVGRGGGDVAGDARVCGKGADGTPLPRGKRQYQGRIVGHMRVRGEAPAKP